MAATIQKPKRKLQHKPVSVIQAVFSPKLYFEFMTSYSLEWCLRYLEREQRLSLSRSYGPYTERASSKQVESDVATFFLPVLFGEGRGRKAKGVKLTGSLEALNDGSTVIRGEVTNSNFIAYILGSMIGLVFLAVSFVMFKDAPLGLLGYIALAVFMGAENWRTKCAGLRYLQSMLCPLDDFESQR